jgi:hypothetical protein
MPQHEPHQEIKKNRDTPMKFRFITPLVCGCAGRGSRHRRDRCDGGRNGRPVLPCRAGCHRQRLRDTGNAQINDSAPVQTGPQYPYREGGSGDYGHSGGHRRRTPHTTGRRTATLPLNLSCAPPRPGSRGDVYL